MTKNKMHVLLSGIIALTLLWKGLYFYHMAYTVGAILIGILLGYYIRYKSIYIEKSLNHLVLLVGVGLYFATVFYAVDFGMAFMGALKVLVVYLFYLVITQVKHQHVKTLFMDTVIVCCVIMAFLGILAFYIPFLGDYFVQNGRLGSVLQYPNTFGLLMIVGILFLVSKNRLNKGSMVGLVLMWTGLFLTFSRSIFIISIGTMVVYVLYDRRRVHSILWPCLLGMGLGYGVMYTSGLSHMIGRIEATSPTVSEWTTRLLYYQDSLAIIEHYPLGTGHLGFFYLQRLYQTGATYFVKYSHSQIIQIGLDIGIIGMALVGIYFIMNMFGKRLAFHEKLAILVLFGHGAMDFDWEFPAVLMVLIMIVYVDQNKIRKLPVSRGLGYILPIGAVMVYMYMGISTYCAYVGLEEAAIHLYPYDTEAKATLARAYEVKDDDRAYDLAQQILRQNPYHLAGHRIMRDLHNRNGELEEALTSARKIVELNPLGISHLEIYSDLLLQQLKEQLTLKHPEKAYDTIRELLEIPYYLERLAKERLTSYNVKHKPNLSMSEKLLMNQQETEQILDILLVE